MSFPLHPPAAWFDRPADIPTDRRLTLETNEDGTPTGRVYGYVALYDTCHAGAPGCVTPPRQSPSNFEYAHQGQTQTAEGTLVATANIGGSGHADLQASPEAAAAHYQEHISTQMMRVRYGADDNGIWFSGALWPDASELDVAHILASPVSGDWRWLNSWRETDAGYDFAGACFVSLPGFAMANAGQVAQAAGSMKTLAASAAWGVSDGGDILAMYARAEPPVKENDMCEKCKGETATDDATEPTIVAAASCAACSDTSKVLCDCGKPVTASAEDDKPVDPIVAAVNAMNDRLTKIEDNERRREAEELTAAIVNDSE